MERSRDVPREAGGCGDSTEELELDQRTCFCGMSQHTGARPASAPEIARAELVPLQHARGWGAPRRHGPQAKTTPKATRPPGRRANEGGGARTLGGNFAPRRRNKQKAISQPAGSLGPKGAGDRRGKGLPSCSQFRGGAHRQGPTQGAAQPVAPSSRLRRLPTAKAPHPTLGRLHPIRGRASPPWPGRKNILDEPPGPTGTAPLRRAALAPWCLCVRTHVRRIDVPVMYV